MITVKRIELETYEIQSVSGTPSVDDLVREITIMFRTRKTSKNIWDFSQCPMSSLQVADYNKIIATIKQFTGTSGQYKTALVVSSEIEHILGETFETMAMMANIPVEYRTFGTREEATKWILE